MNHSPNQRASEVRLVLPQFPHLHSHNLGTMSSPGWAGCHTGTGEPPSPRPNIIILLPGQSKCCPSRNHSTGIQCGMESVTSFQRPNAPKTRSNAPAAAAANALGRREHWGTGSRVAACHVKDLRALNRSWGPHHILHPTLSLCPCSPTRSRISWH